MKVYGKIGMKMYTNELGCMTKVVAIPILCLNPVKIFISRWTYGLGVLEYCSNHDLGLAVTFLRQGQTWENATT